MLSPLLNRLMRGGDLDRDEIAEAIGAMMDGQLSNAQIAAFLVALRMKGETIDEIAAAAQVMREFATRVEVSDLSNLVDTCGTGGDSAGTFNISTTAAFVAAAAGARVAKHGGRSVSSKSGSADVLESLGINLNRTSQEIAEDIDEIGLGFMFAPNFHPAMKYAAPVRRELGVRTLFNILGPLTNPAGAKNQLMGVIQPNLTRILARVLQRLDSRQVMVVHGENGRDGLDEITISGETRVSELRNGEVFEYSIRPEDFGLKTAPIEAIQAKEPLESRRMLTAVLGNQAGPALDIVLLNAGATIYVSGVAGSLEEGVERARTVIKSGAAEAKMREAVAFSNRNKVSGTLGG